jgi:hypothetical protein
MDEGFFWSTLQGSAMHLPMRTKILHSIWSLMNGDQLFILSSSHYTNIKITEHTSNIHRKRYSQAIDLPTQHGIPTATRHALLAAATAHA